MKDAIFITIAKLKIKWINFKRRHDLKKWRKWLIIAAIAGIACLVAAHNLGLPHRYEYVDLNGNHGVANECWITDFGLVCEEWRNKSVIEVHQYSRLR